MKKKPDFGELSSNDFNVGDIVQWSTWDSVETKWLTKYGVVADIKNEIRGNRLVSVSKVIPLTGNNEEIEFFTMSLRLVSPLPEVDDQNEKE